MRRIRRIGAVALLASAVLVAGGAGGPATAGTIGEVASADTVTTLSTAAASAGPSTDGSMTASASASPSASATSATSSISATASVAAVPSVSFAQPSDALAKGLTVSTVIGGGTPVNMEVDTGSNGVLVSRTWVGPDVTPLNPARTFSGWGYSSSGKTYSGEWMTATLQLGAPDSEDHPVQTVPTLIRVVDEDGVAMMGVGFGRSATGPDADLDGPALNPFLNLTTMSSGAMPQAYVIGLTEIVLGPTADDLQGFQTVPLTRTAAGNDWSTAPGCVAIPTGGVPAQCGTLLLDTGLGYAIIQVPDGVEPPTTPAATTGDRPSVANGQQVQITMAGLAQPVYDFTVGGSGAPTSVQWGHLLEDGAPFMNISRYALTQQDYLYDASTGQVGFRSVAAG